MYRAQSGSSLLDELAEDRVNAMRSCVVEAS